jgi:ketosteroid isomerase-like protein
MEVEVSGQNVQLIRGMYGSFARGDVVSVLGAMDPRIEWNEAEGFPYADGNPYVGPQAVVEGVFARLAGEWEYFTVDVEELLDAGDAVVARGRYRAKHRQTGSAIDAQFAHFWWVRDGKATRFQQYTDTAQARAAVGS